MRRQRNSAAASVARPFFVTLFLRLGWGETDCAYPYKPACQDLPCTLVRLLVAACIRQEDETSVMAPPYQSVSPSAFYKGIEYIADADSNSVGRAITIGCGDGSNYCPEDVVTRAAMAAYIARAFLDMD